jgi:hypothetical protein
MLAFRCIVYSVLALSAFADPGPKSLGRVGLASPADELNIFGRTEEVLFLFCFFSFSSFSFFLWSCSYALPDISSIFGRPVRLGFR